MNNLRYALLFLFLGMFLVTNYVQADNGQLAVRLIPSKIMENTDGIIQVYSTSGVPVNKLIATSSDSSIIQITAVEQDETGKFTNIKIHATGSGDAVVALAAPGFSSQEFPITVYKSQGDASDLLAKTTPSAFSTTGPKNGYVTVETINSQGIPVIALKDIPVTLTTSDSSIVKLLDNQIVIKQGTYYAIGNFDVAQPGTATITASSSSMQPTSSQVTVQNISPETIQVYVYPQKINAYSASNSYVIVQLHDSSGNPVQAKEDIPVTVQVTNSTTSAPINTSGQSPLVHANDNLVISKGSYWGYVPLGVSAAVNGTFTVSVSAKGYLSSGSAQFTTDSVPVVMDNKMARADILPILETGNKELIGVAHLEDQSSNPIIANDNLDIQIDSSNLNAVSVSKVQMDRGSQAALIFAQTGSSAYAATLNVLTTMPQTITPLIAAPNVATLSLATEPLISKVLPHTNFPLAIYMTNNGTLDSFAKDSNMGITTDDTVKASSLSVPKDTSVFITSVTLLKSGTQTINIISPGYSSQFTLDTSVSKPKSLLLDHPDQLVSNSRYLFSAELLDDQQNPTVTDSDINLKLVSSDPTVIEVPDSVQVKKGSYYATFEATTHGGGNAEISVLANEIPLSKFSLPVSAFIPTISIDALDHVDPSSTFTATLQATYNQSPINNLAVDWKITGGNIQKMDSTTNTDGKAVASIMVSDPNSLSISATVSGGQYETQTVTKQIAVNPPLLSATSSTASQQNNSLSGFTILGMSPLIFIIPGAAAAAFVVLKKKGVLDGVLEGSSFLDKISGIKERMADLRQS